MGMFDNFVLPASDPANPNAVLGTPADDARKRQLADALVKGGADYSPVASKWQGLARLAQGLVGGYQEGELDRRSAAGQDKARQELAAMLDGSTPAAPAPPQASPVSMAPQPVQSAPLPPAGPIDAGAPPVVRGQSASPAEADAWAAAHPAKFANPAGGEPLDAPPQAVGAGGVTTGAAPYGYGAATTGANRPDPPLAPPAAAPAAPVAAAAPAAQPAAVDRAKLLAVLSNPYSTPAAQQIAQTLLKAQLEPHTQELLKDVDGRPVANRDPRTGAITPITVPPGVNFGGKDEGFTHGVISEDGMGRKQYGRINKKTGETIPDAPGAGGAGAIDAANAADLHGKPFLDTLDNPTRNQVTAIIDGRAPYPSGMLLKTPYGQTLAAYVTQADPSFETGNAGARVKVRNEFNAGGLASPAGQITTGNTAIRHLGEIDDLVDKLGNWSGIPFASYWGNQLGNKAIKGTAAGANLAAFEDARDHYVQEVTKFYSGSSGAEAEKERAIHNLDSAKSPEELRAAIKMEATLMHGKVSALQDRWRQGMGPLVQDFPLIHKESQAVMDRITARGGKKADTEPARAPGPLDVGKSVTYGGVTITREN